MALTITIRECYVICCWGGLGGHSPKNVCGDVERHGSAPTSSRAPPRRTELKEDPMTTTHALSEGLSTVTSPEKARRRLRSVGAVLAGLFSTVLVTTAIDGVLHATGVFPPAPEIMSDALFALALAYRVPLNAAGCYVAGRLAPAEPLRHALLLGALGVVLATLGAVVMWDCGPAWYSLGNIAVALPCALAGGRLAARARRG
jgi:hypothetical protein